MVRLRFFDVEKSPIFRTGTTYTCHQILEIQYVVKPALYSCSSQALVIALKCFTCLVWMSLKANGFVIVREFIPKINSVIACYTLKQLTSWLSCC